MDIFVALKGATCIATTIGSSAIVSNIIKSTSPTKMKPIVKGCVAVTGALMADILGNHAYKQAKEYYDAVEAAVKQTKETIVNAEYREVEDD